MKLTIKIHPQSDENMKFPDYEIVIEDEADKAIKAFKELDYIFKPPTLYRSAK